MTPAERMILDHLDGLDCALNLTALIKRLPELTPEDVKYATRELFEQRRIGRVFVMGVNGSTYPTFFSLYIQTTKGYTDAAPRAPEPVPEPMITPEQTAALMARLEADLAVPSVDAKMEPDLVLAPVPAIPERRLTDRRQRPPRYDVLDVIASWRLPYRLSRVIEILGTSRVRGLAPADAEVVARLVRDHVKDAA